MAPLSTEAPHRAARHLTSLSAFDHENSIKKKGRMMRPADGLPMLATSMRARERLSALERSSSEDPRARMRSAAFEEVVGPRKPSKASMAVQRAQKFEEAAQAIQRMWKSSSTDSAGRNVALIRIIYAEARRKHQMRDSYQKREQMRVMEVNKPRTDDNAGVAPKPTLWQLLQCRDILKEAMEDVCEATKVCSRTANGVRIFQEMGQQRASSKESSLNLDEQDEVELIGEPEPPCSPNTMYARLSREIDAKLDLEEAQERARCQAGEAAGLKGDASVEVSSDILATGGA
mmetsp:Transcript_28692/g.52255  ORF Transcript_28692/g.52255 Transcript_28692/m.52255 type:complete len:289 (+) Transcript_28692:83-949(+)